jgi:DNA polymerase III delta prime subunit
MDVGHANGGSQSGGETQPRQVDSACTWDELVLPVHERQLLQAIPDEVRLRASGVAAGLPDPPVSRTPGITALFVGPPGTGKTMAAKIIAADLGLPVCELDLAALSPEQEFEELLGRTIDDAESTNAILVIDGAGPSLRRTPATERDGVKPTPTGPVDRLIAPSAGDEGHARAGSLSLLLERSRRYPGLVIFTSTVTHPLDSSLAERFDVVVNFPFPERDARKEIWRNSLPNDARLTESTLDYLATWLDWPGRTIHGCSLAAADEAAKEGVPVELRHVASVLEHGYRTSGLPEQPSAIRSRTEAWPVDTGAGRRWRLLALGGVVIAAALGLIIAGTTGGAPANSAGSNVAYAGAVRVSVPSRWRREPVPAALSVGLAQELALASPPPERGSLVIGTVAAGDPSQLPQRLLATLPPTIAPALVRVDHVVLERYLSRPSSEGPGDEAIFVLPSTLGTIIGICKTEGASPDFMGNCERVLGTIKLTTGSAVRLPLSANYARALNAAIDQLNAVSLAAGTQLASATSARAQAAAAARLARAHSQAASALEHISAGTAPAANGPLAKALVATASAYSALAVAATHNDAHAYDAARAEVARTGRALNLAFGRLRGLGYRVA